MLNSPRLNISDISATFEAADADANGFLSVVELRAALPMIGEQAGSARSVAMLHSRFDADAGTPTEALGEGASTDDADVVALSSIRPSETRKSKMSE